MVVKKKGGMKSLKDLFFFLGVFFFGSVWKEKERKKNSGLFGKKIRWPGEGEGGL